LESLSMIMKDGGYCLIL
jgi:hypothetical protein